MTLHPCSRCRKVPIIKRRAPKVSLGINGDYHFCCGCPVGDAGWAGMSYINYKRSEAIKAWNTQNP